MFRQGCVTCYLPTGYVGIPQMGEHAEPSQGLPPWLRLPVFESRFTSVSMRSALVPATRHQTTDGTDARHSLFT